MATGTVDFFNDTGGYGFIETDEAVSPPRTERRSRPAAPA